MKIDPKQQGHLPRVDEPSPFVSPDGRFRGWRVTISGRRSLATSAVVDGRVFVGGGFGSYDFYAFDARDGRLAWQYQTSDDGPTAAAVAEGHVVFNTESCELEVVTVEGTPVWKKWLGDPLMSMPAVGAGRIYMAYPDSKGDRRHYLACFDLRTGHEYWKQPIEGEIITAPVLAGGNVHWKTKVGTHQSEGDDLLDSPLTPPRHRQRQAVLRNGSRRGPMPLGRVGGVTLERPEGRTDRVPARRGGRPRLRRDRLWHAPLPGDGRRR
jgi:outer membrane protein assembly factor BamB